MMDDGRVIEEGTPGALLRGADGGADEAVPLQDSLGRCRRSPRIPELGARGGGWVAAQLLLLAAIGASALVEPRVAGRPAGGGIRRSGPC